MSNVTRGKFIVIDGIDGSGKSTEIRLLKKELGGRALFTHEPGGTKFAEKIREVLLARERGSSSALSDFFLFWAARAAHVREVIAPALERGTHVVSDRFDSSTFAFQVCAERQPRLKDAFRACRAATLEGATPDAYLILDLPVARAQARRKDDVTKTRTAFDKKPAPYHERVRAGFKKFKPGKGSKVFIIDANHAADIVHQDVWKIVQNVLRTT